MISIQTNVTSLQAQQDLNVNNAFQANTIQQLSSGYRINSSADDAAGLAVANQYNSDTVELQQGVRNANDGLSQLQIVDGGLSNISTMLNRMKTLATESATSTFTGDRTTLNNEYQDLISEITRQASNVGLNAGGLLNKELSVYIGGGRTSNQTGSSQVNINLSGSANAVDANSLGLSATSVIGGGTSFSNNSVTNLSDTNALFNVTGSAAGTETFGVDYVDTSGAVQHQNVTINATAGGVTGAQFATAVNNALQGTGVTAQIGGGGDLQFSGTNLLQVTAGTSGTAAPVSQAVTSGATLLNSANYQSTGAFTALTGSTVPASATTETINVLVGGTNHALTLSSVDTGTSAGDTVAHALASLNSQLQGTGVYATADAAGANITLQSANVFSVTSAAPSVGASGAGAAGSGSFFGTAAGAEAVTGTPYTVSGAFTPLTPGVGGSQAGTVEAMVLAIGGANYNLTLNSSTSGTAAGDSIQDAVASLNSQLGTTYAGTPAAGIVASISANGQNIVLTSPEAFTLSASVTDGTGGAAAPGAGYVMGTTAGSATVTPSTYQASGAFTNFVAGAASGTNAGTATTETLLLNGQTLTLTSATNGTSAADNIGDAVASLTAQIAAAGTSSPLAGISVSASGGNIIFTSDSAFTLSQSGRTQGVGGAAIAGAGSYFATAAGSQTVSPTNYSTSGAFTGFATGTTEMLTLVGTTGSVDVILSGATSGTEAADTMTHALASLASQLSGSGISAIQDPNNSNNILFKSTGAFTLAQSGWTDGGSNGAADGVLFSTSAGAETVTPNGPYTTNGAFTAFTNGSNNGASTAETLDIGGYTVNLTSANAGNIGAAIQALNNVLVAHGIQASTSDGTTITLTSNSSFAVTEDSWLAGAGVTGAAGSGLATAGTPTATGPFTSTVNYEAFTPGNHGGTATSEGMTLVVTSGTGAGTYTLSLTSATSGTTAADTINDALASLNHQLIGSGVNATTDGSGHIVFTSPTSAFTLTENTNTPGNGQLGAPGAGSWFTVGTTPTPETVSGGPYTSTAGVFTPFLPGAGTSGTPTSETLSIAGHNLTLTSATSGTEAADTLADALASLTAQLTADGLTGFSVAGTAAAGTSPAEIQFTANQSFSLSEMSYNAGVGGAVLGGGGMYTTAGAQAITAPTVNSTATGNAQTAVLAINAAVTALGLAQGNVGAGENTLNYAISLAQSQVTNFSAAESQIKDADIAAEAANLTKAQVLEQASIAAMAQANTSPQAVLKLLQ